jgi:hypothetical protein
MSPIVASFLRSAVLPAVLTTVGLIISGRLNEPMKARIQALILGLGFCLGNYLLLDRMHIPPTDVSEAFSLAALILVGYIMIRPGGAVVRYGVRVVMVALIGAAVLYHLGRTLQDPIHQRNALAFFFLGVGVWSILERKSYNVSVLSLIVMPLISATAVSLLILFASSASMAQIVSIICTILGGAALIAVVKPQLLSKHAFIPFLSVFLIAFMVVGHFYQDINPWHMVFICWPIAVLWVRNFMKFIPHKPLIETLVLAAISIAPVGYFLWTIYQKAGPLY